MQQKHSCSAALAALLGLPIGGCALTRMPTNTMVAVETPAEAPAAAPVVVAAAPAAAALVKEPHAAGVKEPRAAVQTPVSAVVGAPAASSTPARRHKKQRHRDTKPSDS